VPRHFELRPHVLLKLVAICCDLFRVFLSVVRITNQARSKEKLLTGVTELSPLLRARRLVDILIKRRLFRPPLLECAGHELRGLARSDAEPITPASMIIKSIDAPGMSAATRFANANTYCVSRSSQSLRKTIDTRAIPAKLVAPPSNEIR
jgi:hypothetical protein